MACDSRDGENWQGSEMLPSAGRCGNHTYVAFEKMNTYFVLCAYVNEILKKKSGEDEEVKFFISKSHLHFLVINENLFHKLI